MKNVFQTVQSVRALLASGMPNSASDKTAADYARLCSDVEQRLEMAAAMLEKGSDYQALQVAEQDPPLLDLAGALSFGEERAWQEFCEAHHLPVAQRLNARTVQALDALYARGITANHPLYKDFRAAVLSRDDTKALQTVRTILKLNPADENARKELQRLDNKRMQEALEQLREALTTDDEERIACLTEGLAASAPEEKLKRVDAYVAGESIRRSFRRRQAEHQLPELMTQMLAQQTEGNWQEVGLGLETIKMLIDEHGIEVSDESCKQQLDDLRQFFERDNAVDQKRQDFEKALRNFVADVEEVETCLRIGTSPAYNEIAAKDESFVRQWKELEAHQMPVPVQTLQRLQAVGQALRTRLKGLQRARRMRRVAIAAVIVGALLCTTALGLHGWKAYSISQELLNYQNRQVCSPAEELIRKLRHENELLLHWPYLQAKIEEVDAWTRQVRATEKQATDAAQMLASSFAGESSKLPPGQLVRQLEDAEALVRSLARDLAEGPRNQLLALRTRVEFHLARVGKQLATEAGASLADIEQTSARELSFEKLATHMAETVNQIESKLAPLEAALKPEAEALRLPAPLESKILELRQRLDSFEDELKKFDKVRTETAAADSLATYKTALAGWREVRFAEAAPAAKALAALPTEAAFLAALLMDGDESALKAVLDDLSGPYMQPAAPLDEDLKTLLTLRDDVYLNNIWENKIVDYSRGSAESTLWSTGMLTRANIGENVRWSGRYYDVSQGSTSVIFTKRDLLRVPASGGYIGIGVAESKLSPTSEFINSLQLNRMTDEDGKRFMHSLLEMFEKVMKDKGGSLIAKAYVVQRLENMLHRREFAWGLHFCPSLKADLRELQQILGETSLRSEDWLVAAMRARLTTPLTAFFKRCEARSYLKEASARRGLLRSAALAGLRFGGYVEVDLSLVLNNPARASNELWVLAGNGGKPKLVENSMVGKAAAEAAKLVAKDALPLSPVFFMSLDRSQLLKQYEADLVPAKSALKPLSGEARFLNP
ncbi:MAG: hypothetical protein ACKVY0_14085 [Prosthecobacter sp.]|uniref:hypothetical protein n=1 Tax=Prosthecobacter sp. TaxID=1965333 RepID=UPI00390285BC